MIDARLDVRSRVQILYGSDDAIIVQVPFDELVFVGLAQTTICEVIVYRVACDHESHLITHFLLRELVGRRLPDNYLASQNHLLR